MSINRQNGSNPENPSQSEQKTDEVVDFVADPSRRDFNKLLGGLFLTGMASGPAATLVGCINSEKDKKPTSDIPEVEKKAIEPAPELSETELKKLIEKNAIKSITPINSPSFVAPPVLKGESDVEKMMELQKHWKEISLNALRKFEDADPRVTDLLQLMEKHAFYTIPNGPVVTHMVDKGPGAEERMMAIAEDPFAFEIVFMPEQYANHYPSSIMTNGKTMRIATTFKSEEWLGIMLAHELSHIRDFVLHNENTKNKSEYLRGEVNAHLLEMELLKYWNPDTYSTLIKAGAPLTSEKELRREKFFDLIESLYPLDENMVSHNEKGLGGASCLLAIWLEEAKRRGLSEKEMQNVYGFVVSKL